MENGLPLERICVTMGQKVNLGNYESADVSICLSGIPLGASEELIEEMLATAKIAYSKIGARIKNEVAVIRAGKGHG